MKKEYPKALYLHGWDDLSAFVTVDDAQAETQARSIGYRMLTDVAETQQISQNDDTAKAEAPMSAAPAEAPKRRGRPPKVTQ